MSLFVRGIPRTRLALAAAERAVELAAPTAVRAAGEALAREMVSRAPRATGATASSVRVDVDSLGDGATAHVGPTTSYARFRNFGTVYVSGLHWMEGSADASVGQIVAVQAAIFRAAIERGVI